MLDRFRNIQDIILYLYNWLLQFSYCKFFHQKF